MTTFKSDGTLPTGSVDITILESSEIYTANNFTWTQDTTSDVQRNHADGLPKGFEVKPGFTNGTLDLQLADNRCQRLITPFQLEALAMRLHRAA